MVEKLQAQDDKEETKHCGEHLVAKKRGNGNLPLATTSIGHFVNDGSLQLVPLAFPLWAGLYGFTTLELSLIGAMVSLVALPSAPFIGRLSDRTKKPGPLIGVGVLMLSFGVLALALVRMVAPLGSNLLTYSLILASAGVIGLGSGFYHPLAASVLQTTYGSKNRGLMMGVNGAFGGVGSALYPILFSLLVVRVFLSGTFLAFGAIGVLAAIIAALLIRRVVSRDSVLGIIRTNNQIATPLVQEVNKRSTTSKVVVRAIYVLTIVAFLRALTGQGIFNFLPIFLVRNRDIEISQAALIVGTIYVVATLGQLGWGYLSDKLGRRFALGTSTFGVGASFILYLLLPANSNLAFASLLFFGIFTYSAFPLLLALAGEVVGKESIATSNSIVWGVGVVAGSTVGPLLVGVLSEGFALGSLTQALFVISIPGMIGALLMFFVPKPLPK